MKPLIRGRYSRSARDCFIK